MIKKYCCILSEFLSAVSLSWCQLSRLTFVGEDTCENSLSENAKSGFSLSCFAKLETNQFFDDIGSFNIDKNYFYIVDQTRGTCSGRSDCLFSRMPNFSDLLK